MTALITTSVQLCNSLHTFVVHFFFLEGESVQRHIAIEDVEETIADKVVPFDFLPNMVREVIFNAFSLQLFDLFDSRGYNKQSK